MDELSGSSAASETDTATDSDTNVATAATTAKDYVDSYDTVGDGTFVNYGTDTSTETDSATDNDDSTVINSEQDGDTVGSAGIVLSGFVSITMTDVGSNDESLTDVNAETDNTGAQGLEGEVNVYTPDEAENETATETDTQTLTLTGSDPFSLTEIASQILGTSGLVTGGAILSVDSEGESDTWSSTEGGSTSEESDIFSTESDTGGNSIGTEAEQDSGSFASDASGSNSAGSSESTTETLGDGGLVVGGSFAESGTVGSSSEASSTETVGTSQSTSEQSIDLAEYLWTIESGASDSETDTDAASSTGAVTETETEVLGALGTITAESDSLNESAGETTAETDHPTETLTRSVVDGSWSYTSMTLTETNTDAATDNESDQDWATETMSPSDVIASGSDCFTISDLEATSATSSGTGPENYNDTSGSPDGTATVNGATSTSDLVYQTLGDILGTGGVIASGSLSYTVTNSDYAADTTFESGTETIPDEISATTDYLNGGYGPADSQTASYTVDTTTPENDTAYETGTETLGAGGTISGGSASFTLNDDSSINRSLTIAGIATTLSVKETSTDTDDIGQSGTETITAGGGDAPGSVNFLWTQLGTDSYSITQANSVASTSYALNFADTESASWQDAGVESLTNSDVLTGYNDTYTWNALHSETDSAYYSSLLYGTNSFTVNGNDAASDGLLDTGSDTISNGSLVAVTNSYTIGQSYGNSYSSSPGPYGGGGSFSLNDKGNESLSGTLSYSSQSYSLTDTESGTFETFPENVGQLLYSELAVILAGTDSFSTGGARAASSIRWWSRGRGVRAGVGRGVEHQQRHR